jgi:hypothetical protein
MRIKASGKALLLGARVKIRQWMDGGDAGLACAKHYAGYTGNGIKINK